MGSHFGGGELRLRVKLRLGVNPRLKIKLKVLNKAESQSEVMLNVILGLSSAKPCGMKLYREQAEQLQLGFRVVG